MPYALPVLQEEEPQEFVLADGRRVRRTGYCCRCGACCQSEQGPCVYFARREDGLGECVGRDSALYLNGCNVWPSKPEHVALYPECTYRFERIE
jgi:hypothetical protein